MMIIRAIHKEDNPHIAQVIRQVFIDDHYPKTGTAFADSQLDCMFETYDRPRSVYFVIEVDMSGAQISSENFLYKMEL